MEKPLTTKDTKDTKSTKEAVPLVLLCRSWRFAPAGGFGRGLERGPEQAVARPLFGLGTIAGIFAGIEFWRHDEGPPWGLTPIVRCCGAACRNSLQKGSRYTAEKAGFAEAGGKTGRGDSTAVTLSQRLGARRSKPFDFTRTFSCSSRLNPWNRRRFTLVLQGSDRIGTSGHRDIGTSGHRKTKLTTEDTKDAEGSGHRVIAEIADSADIGKSKSWELTTEDTESAEGSGTSGHPKSKVHRRGRRERTEIGKSEKQNAHRRERGEAQRN